MCIVNLGVEVHFLFLYGYFVLISIIFEKTSFSIELLWDFSLFSLVFKNLTMMYLDVIFFMFILLGFHSASSGDWFFKNQIWKRNLSHHFFKYLFLCQSFSLPSETPITYLLDYIMSHKSLKLCSFLSYFPPLCCLIL